MYRLKFTSMREIEASLRAKLRQDVEVGAPQELTDGSHEHIIRVPLKSPSGSDLVFELSIQERQRMFFVAGLDVKARARMLTSIDMDVIGRELARVSGDLKLVKAMLEAMYQQITDWVRENR